MHICGLLVLTNILKKKKIDKIFSTGGYMSLPIILAARLLDLKIYLLEPNHVLGRANRYYLKHCNKIFCYTKYQDFSYFPYRYKVLQNLIQYQLRPKSLSY